MSGCPREKAAAIEKCVAGGMERAAAARLIDELADMLEIKLVIDGRAPWHPAHCGCAGLRLEEAN